MHVPGQSQSKSGQEGSHNVADIPHPGHGHGWILIPGKCPLFRETVLAVGGGAARAAVGRVQRPGAAGGERHAAGQCSLRTQPRAAPADRRAKSGM